MKTLLYLALFSLIAFSHCQETESTCQTSADCPGSNTCEENICVRHNVFPLNGKEVLGTFISVIMNVLLNIGGVGGGAVHIPYIHLLYETTIEKAVTISYACVFGASLGYVFSTIPIKDPITKRYLINYDINLITLPAVMVGVGIGSVISRLLSPLVTGIIIIFVLGYAIMKNAFKFKAALRKELLEEHSRRVFQTPEIKPMEAKAIEAKPEPVIISAPSIQDVMSKNDLADQEQETVKNFKRKPLPASTTIISSASTFERTYSRVLSILVKDNAPLTSDEQIEIQVDAAATVPTKAEYILAKEQKFPFAKLMNVLVNVLSIVIFGLIRGTKNFKSIFGKEWSLSWDFLWLSLGTLCFCLATVKSIYDVLKWQKEKQEVNYIFPPQEPVLNKPRIISLLTRAVIGGFASAVSTLAGALIIAPALLNMGMPGAFAAATTNFFMILSMFSAMLNILLTGALSIQEALWFMLFSCLFSVLVTKSLNFYVKKTGKDSTVIGLILIGTIIGVMCLISVMMQSLMENLSQHVQFGSIHSN